tara:strand:- start:4955 stop:5188 length:234 start_codon:yes stop_codon:yes gene_type:complete
MKKKCLPPVPDTSTPDVCPPTPDSLFPSVCTLKTAASMLVNIGMRTYITLKGGAFGGEDYADHGADLYWDGTDTYKG